MRFQKGQSVVEFALVLPIFLLLVYGVFYIGMIFADYMALNNIARSSAREASLITVEKDVSSGYQTVIKKYADVKLPLDAFDWDPTSSTDFSITYDSANQNVKVAMNASLNAKKSSIAQVFYNLTNDKEKDIKLQVTYTMYSEYKKQ